MGGGFVIKCRYDVYKLKSLILTRRLLLKKFVPTFLNYFWLVFFENLLDDLRLSEKYLVPEIFEVEQFTLKIGKIRFAISNFHKFFLRDYSIRNILAPRTYNGFSCSWPFINSIYEFHSTRVSDMSLADTSTATSIIANLKW